MDITKLSEIELLSLQTAIAKEFKLQEANLNAINKEMQRRVGEYDKAKIEKARAEKNGDGI